MPPARDEWHSWAESSRWRLGLGIVVECQTGRSTAVEVTKVTLWQDRRSEPIADTQACRSKAGCSLLQRKTPPMDEAARAAMARVAGVAR